MATEKHNRREEIIAAAIDIFRREGYRGATLDMIAAAVGVTKAAFYFYYRNKIDLLAEIYSRVGTTLYAHLQPVFEDSTLCPTEKLRLIIREHVRLAIENQAIFSIYFREQNELTAEVRRRVAEGERRYIHALQGVIGEGVRSGEFMAEADPLAVSFVILGACNWVVFWYHDNAHGGRIGPEQLADQIFQSTVHGLVHDRRSLTECAPT